MYLGWHNPSLTTLPSGFLTGLPTTLSRLSLEGFNLTDSELATIGSRFTSVTTLHLGGSGLSAAQTNALLDALAANPTVANLALDGNDLSGVDWTKLSEITSLRALDVTGANLNDSDAAEIAANAPAGLLNLYLGYNALTAVPSLARFARLPALVLEHNNLDDADLTANTFDGPSSLRVEITAGNPGITSTIDELDDRYSHVSFRSYAAVAVTSLAVAKTVIGEAPAGQEYGFSLSCTATGTTPRTHTFTRTAGESGYVPVHAPGLLTGSINAATFRTVGAATCTLTEPASHGALANDLFTDQVITRSGHTAAVTNIHGPIPPFAVRIAAANAEITEGEDAVFTITAIPAPPQDLPVDLRVTARGNYGVQERFRHWGGVTIKAGQTSATYRVPTSGDTVDEPNGTVTVGVLVGQGYGEPYPVDPANDYARVTIQDDDGGPEFRIEVDREHWTVTEGGAAVFKVVASPVSTTPVAVNLAIIHACYYGEGCDHGVLDTGLNSGMTTETVQETVTVRGKIVEKDGRRVRERDTVKIVSRVEGRATLMIPANADSETYTIQTRRDEDTDLYAYVSVRLLPSTNYQLTDDPSGVRQRQGTIVICNDADNDGECDERSPEEFTPDPDLFYSEPPSSTPSAQLGEAPGGSRLTVSWDEVAEATGYDVRWGVAAAPARQTARVSEPEFTTPELAPGVAHAFQVSACNDAGCSAQSPAVQGQGAAEPVQPTANAGPDLAGAPGGEVTLQGKGSTNPYGKWYQMAHQWTQLSGPPVTLTHPNTGQAAANFGDPRFTIPADVADGTTLEFELTVTDEEGESNSDTLTVTVAVTETIRPTAQAGPDLTGAPGGEVTLQGTDSINPYGAWWRMRHQWTQLSGPPVTLTHPKTSQPASNYADPRFIVPAGAADGATLEFELTVTDQEGESDSDTVTVTVIRPDNTPPVVAELALVRVFTDETVQLTGSATDYEDAADALTYLWEQTGLREQTGGTPAVSIDGASTATASFTAPAVSGETALTFRLSVTDSGGLTASRKTTVTVLPTPTACAGDDLTSTAGTEITLEGICSTNPYGEWWRMAHQWTQLAGPSVTLTHPQTELYNQAADKFGDPRFTIPADAAAGTTLEFQLTVTDKEGGTDTDTVTVTVTSESSSSG